MMRERKLALGFEKQDSTDESGELSVMSLCERVIFLQS